VAQTVALTLGVREQPGRTILDALLDYVRAKHLLLLLPFSYSNVREHSRAVSSSCFIVDSHGTGTFGSALPFRSHINSPGILRPAVATLQDGQLYA
jgi:hypothetical protein